MMREVDLARVVVAWLRREGWDVYQEVHTGSCTCDIVATRGPLIWAIETKLHFGTAVIDQARNWLRGAAHLVSVATLPTRNRFSLYWDYCKWKGIGWLTVNEYGVKETSIEPTLTRRLDATRSFRNHLRPEQLTGIEAGGNSGGYHTPFKQTCREVAAIVQGTPGISLKDLLVKLGRGHYASSASARAGIAHWAKLGKVPDVEVRQEGRAIRLFPKAAA